jgi:uncharacterized protein (TIGR00251 family)
VPATDPDRDGPFRAQADGVRIAVRVQPRASRARIDGVEDRGDGAAALKVRVTEAPEGGKANAAVIKLLAKAWGLPKSAMSVVAGAKDRNKTVFVAGEPAALMQRLRVWAADRRE